MFSNAKVGDKVWSFVHGWGEIVETNQSKELPLRVEFQIPKGVYGTSFTLDGKYAPQMERSVLFWQEFEAPERAYRKPLPDLKVDTKVLVWNDIDIGETGIINKRKRYFKKFSDDNRIITFPLGTTSWTAEVDSTDMLWDNWEFAEVNKEVICFM